MSKKVFEITKTFEKICKTIKMKRGSQTVFESKIKWILEVKQTNSSIFQNLKEVTNTNGKKNKRKS